MIGGVTATEKKEKTSRTSDGKGDGVAMREQGKGGGKKKCK